MLLIVAMVAPMRSSDAQMIMGMTLSALGTVTGGTCAVLRIIFLLSEKSQVGGSDYFPVIFDSHDICMKMKLQESHKILLTMRLSLHCISLISQLISFSSPSVSSCF